MRILHSKKLIFISKPRCGSTSVRRFLDSQMQEGDEKCDYGNEFPNMPELHPHMSAPAVHSYLCKKGVDVDKYTTFTITRHPVAMLWSYYNYFKPDVNYRYNYSPEYQSAQLLDFSCWLKHGHVGIGLWREFCPDFITGNDFSPLSLEAHANDKNNINLIDKVFKLESLSECEAWLGDFFDINVDIDAVNQSDSTRMPKLSEELLDKVRSEFAVESILYKI
ncbi:hypothetical protein [Shewanella youngdeokensis]|uniref:Sulfotransferase family protein n=1 Tax=Shewanella youngdeokensis TaxID=2999068 RepID=A0ABZ0K2G5_9GAMM|nr:hypothetical protein RGE70_05720 [Shewanella sp. DAU334]